MKKNVMMRLACFLLVAVLISTSAISGTYAKYVTADEGSDTARVAKWGVVASVDGTLFNDSYQDNKTTWTENEEGLAITVQAATKDQKVVAPGTKNDEGMTIILEGAPEVDVEVVFTFKANEEIYAGAGGYTDAEGAYEAVFYEDEEKYVGYGVYDIVVSRELCEYPKTEWKCILRPGDRCLSIHLPRGSDITREAIDRAVNAAYEVIRKGYPEYADAPIHGASWLLDPGLAAFLKPDVPRR